jgi:dethiobiotin synthetase
VIARPPRLFVTGTDTGVGKTAVTSALVTAWRRRGRRVAAMKPIETGCRRDGNQLVPDDGTRLARAAGGLDLGDVCPIRFELPASPAAAAGAVGASIDLAIIDRALARLSDGAEAVIVEGAGGLLVPIDGATTMADLALRVGARLLVVARSSLGTINHTLLTVESARARGLHVLGIVLNQVAPVRGPEESSTPATIATMAALPVLGTLPHYSTGISDDALADLAELSLDTEALWRSLFPG